MTLAHMPQQHARKHTLRGTVYLDIHPHIVCDILANRPKSISVLPISGPLTQASNSRIQFDIKAPNRFRTKIALSPSSPQCGAGPNRTCQSSRSPLTSFHATERYLAGLDKTKSPKTWNHPYHSHQPVYPTGTAEHDHFPTSTPTSMLKSPQQPNTPSSALASQAP